MAELEEQIGSAESATQSFVTSLAEMVNKSVISVSDIALVNSDLAKAVEYSVSYLTRVAEDKIEPNSIVQYFSQAEDSVVSFGTTAIRYTESYGKAMDEYYSKLYGFDTEFYKASESIVNNTDSSILVVCCI